MPRPARSVSQILRDFTDSLTGDHVTLGQMIHAFEDRGLPLLLLAFALLCMVPIPIPGIHVFLSLPLWVVTGQMVIGQRHIWMPAKVIDHTLPRQTFADVAEKSIPWIQKIERFSRVRLAFLTDGIWYCLAGAISMFFTGVIAIPGPLTNFVPAMAICFIALGLILKDGLLIIGGTILGIVWTIFLSIVYIGTLIFFIQKAFEWLG